MLVLVREYSCSMCYGDVNDAICDVNDVRCELKTRDTERDDDESCISRDSWKSRHKKPKS